MDENKVNNLVAKHARKYNKAAVHKDRKKAMKKGDRKHKGRYEEVGNVDEISTTVSISNLLKKTANRKKYDKAVSDIKSGKYKIGKAAQVYNLDPKTLQSMMEKLSPSDGAGEYVKDFRKSDAPQFKGKSDKKKQQMAIAAYLDAKDKKKTNEDLRKWFGKGKEGDWVRVGTDGEIKGDCARDEGEGKPKCMPRSKAHSMSKKDRASSARRKRAKDPTVDRPGTGNKPIMVSTDKKESALPPHLQKILDKKGNIKKGKVRIKGRPSSSKSKVTDVKVPGYTSRESVEEWACTRSEKTRRVKGGDKRKKYMKEKQIEEKNEPTNPKLWAKFKAQAKSKFDVYPSAYANGWAAKQYKAAGGGWKTVKEGKNTPGDGNPCWDTHKKVGTKMKNGKRVNDCVPKNEGKFDVKKNMVRKNDADEFIKQTGKGLDQNHKDVMAALKDLQKRRKMREMDEALSTQQRSVIGKAADAKRREKTATTNAVKKAAQRAQVDKKISEGRSAQDRLDARAAKLGIGKPNKAADDYLSKMMKKYGAKDMADLKKKMGMKEDSFDYKYEPELRDRLEELTQRELDMMKQRKQANLVKRGKAKAQPKGAGRVGNTGRRGGEGGEDDSSLVMQLRKAQDLRGNYDIKFKGGTTKLPKQMIDKLLNTYNKLKTPADKKKFETLLTHELRKKEGIATQKSKTAADKAMDKFNKTKGRGLPAPRGKKGGPSDRELRDIERGK